MRYIVVLWTILLTVFIAMSFGRKCDHVFTQVAQAKIKIEKPNLLGGMTSPIEWWPAGIQDGNELVCVKCFHVQKQVLDYGLDTVNTMKTYKSPAAQPGLQLNHEYYYD